MTGPHSRPHRPLTDLASDLAAVARRHDPSWTAGNDADPGVTLLELQAWLADVLGTRQDRIADEASLGTAQQGSGAVGPFRGNTHRYDPYRNFKFRVKWDGREIPGKIAVSALGWRAEEVEYREGGDPSTHHVPGRIRFEPLVLQREVSPDTAFETWSDQVRQLASSAGPAAGATYRKQVRIELLDAAGRVTLAYDAYQCWPSGYRVLVEARDVAGRARMLEELTLSCEGWQRDAGVVWPAESG
jgi:phage tail-like protein